MGCADWCLAASWVGAAVFSSSPTPDLRSVGHRLYGGGEFHHRYGDRQHRGSQRIGVPETLVSG